MKILYFHQYFSTPSGAVGNRSYMMARRLIDAGHCVTIVCGNSENCNTGLNAQFNNRRREGFVDGIRVIELDFKYSNYLSFSKLFKFF